MKKSRDKEKNIMSDIAVSFVHKKGMHMLLLTLLCALFANVVEATSSFLAVRQAPEEEAPAAAELQESSADGDEAAAAAYAGVDQGDDTA